jgi:hypothetical protein
VLGVFLILVSTLAYNGSVVLLAAEARRQPGGSSLLVAVGRRAPGLLAILLNLLGWVLEIAALALISLTLVRILSVAGLGILLWMARWALKEPLGLREFLGVGLVALGIAAVSFAPPSLGSTPPTLKEWMVIVVILGPAVLLPYALRVLRRPVGPNLGAVASGLAYALNGILSKGISESVAVGLTLPLALLLGGATLTGLLGFAVELDALKHGRASVVASIVLALHTVVPIACAPFVFDESWPAGPLLQVLLSAGIFLTLLGTLVLSSSSSHVLVKR